MRRSPLLLMVALAGCSAPTSLLLHIDLDRGFVPTVQTALVTLSTGGRISQAVDPTTRSLTILLPDAALDVTVQVSDTDAQGDELTGSITTRTIPRTRIERTICVGHHCAATPDLGSVDLSTADMTLPFCGGPSRCAGAGVALCQDFESGAITMPWGQRVDNGAALVFDSTMSCRGTQSVHLTTPPLTSSLQIASYVFEQQVLPTSTLFVRAFLYAPPQTWPTPFTTVVQAFQLQSPYESDELELLPDATYRNVASTSIYVQSPPSPSPLPSGRWVCVEWEIASATDATGALHAWIDGVPAPIDITNMITQSSPPLGAVAVGLDLKPTSSSSQVDLWIDEIAVDTQRIGCTR